MKKILLTIFLSAMAMTASAKEWYEEDGNLHDKTMQEWCAATAANKLATAGDFVALGYKENLYKPKIMETIKQAGMPGMKLMAEGIVKGLDTAGCNGKSATKEAKDQQVKQMAALLIGMMGWLK